MRVLPCNLLGVPIQSFAIAQRFLTAHVADALNAPIVRAAVDSIDKLGLKTAPRVQCEMIERTVAFPYETSAH